MQSSKLVCVVDDQADFRFMVQQIFKQYIPAYPVRFFDNGHALLNELVNLKPKPSLILLDRHMPHLNGHQTLVSLKEHSAYKKIPVVMLSADANAVEINGCYEAGANSFLLKKVDFFALKKMLEDTCHYWLETNQEPPET